MQIIYGHSTLKEADFTLNNILDISEEGFWDWNVLTGNVDRSHGWFRMLGYDITKSKKNVFTWEDVIHPDDYSRVMKNFELYINGEIPNYKIKYRCQKFDKTYIWIEDSGKIVQRTDEGKVTRMIGAHTNINDAEVFKNELIKQNKLLSIDKATLEDLVHERTLELNKTNVELLSKIKEAEHDASHDALTGLYNRRIFESLFQKEIHRAKRYSYPLSVAILDIDNFKNINDTYGHKFGDEILIGIAILLQQHTRDSDILARWGGEEFIIVFPQSNISNAKDKADKLRKTIENKMFPNFLKITASFGVTSYLEEDTESSFFVRCDKALYKAKELEKNNVQVL